MTKAPSPLLGYNNNVRHKNRVFHIQTENSSVKHPHIITHLFMDGGRILKSVKTSYARARRQRQARRRRSSADEGPAQVDVPARSATESSIPSSTHANVNTEENFGARTSSRRKSFRVPRAR